MKTVLVTGGSRGIGAEVCKIFAKNGFKVILNYNKSKEEAQKIQQMFPTQIEIYKADISKSAEVEKMIETFTNIDVLVNNAGISSEKLITDLTENEWDEIFNVNVKGVFLASKYVAKRMINNKLGRIINLSSIWGITGGSMEVAYSASKSAVIGFTKALAKEVAPCGITVNAVAPGVINTDMTTKFSQETIDLLKEEIPLGILGEVEDVAHLVYFLASKEARFITGQVISPNGGMVI